MMKYNKQPESNRFQAAFIVLSNRVRKDRIMLTFLSVYVILKCIKM